MEQLGLKLFLTREANIKGSRLAYHATVLIAPVHWISQGGTWWLYASLNAVQKKGEDRVSCYCDHINTMLRVAYNWRNRALRIIQVTNQQGCPVVFALVLWGCNLSLTMLWSFLVIYHHTVLSVARQGFPLPMPAEKLSDKSLLSWGMVQLVL